MLPSDAFAGCGDPCAPDWCDPISRVPNFFGDFFERNIVRQVADGSNCDLLICHSILRSFAR
jgi:hypothetical protein